MVSHATLEIGYDSFQVRGGEGGFSTGRLRIELEATLHCAVHKFGVAVDARGGKVVFELLSNTREVRVDRAWVDMP
jgi:hypothetical protein